MGNNTKTKKEQLRSVILVGTSVNPVDISRLTARSLPLKNQRDPFPARMHLRSVALLCLSWAWLSERTHPRLVLDEVVTLRQEIQEAREVIHTFHSGVSSCEWKLWAQDWAPRLSAALDLFLLTLLILQCLARKLSAPRTGLALEDIGETDPPGDQIKEEASEATSLAGSSTLDTSPRTSTTPSTSRKRPTRPSDLRQWRTSP